MTHCPNCGQPVEPEAKACPHCGTDLLAVWPPPPEGQRSGLPPHLPEAPGTVFLGFLLGMGVGGGWWYIGAGIVYGMSEGTYTHPARLLILADMLLFGPPAIMAGAVSLLLRPNKPKFARGLGYSVPVLLALMLGAIAICH